MSDVDDAITVGNGGVYVNIHTQPGARKSQVRGMYGDAIKIAVREAARDGKANAAIVNFVADTLGYIRQDVEVASGHASRRKRLFISGNSYDITARIQNMINEPKIRH